MNSHRLMFLSLLFWLTFELSPILKNVLYFKSKPNISQITVNGVAILHSIMIMDTTRNSWKLHLFKYGQCCLKVKWMFCRETKEDKQTKIRNLLPHFKSQVKVYLSISDVQVTSTVLAQSLYTGAWWYELCVWQTCQSNLCSNKNTWRVAGMLKKEVHISLFYLCVLNKIS